ncbi:ABC transporter permease [Mucilaginibacter sp. UR6-1]|uniref:ABC transporter permease n=1 Tax=Mucilaginibacter sp. UR6-1 TaxID=1435643 RepID=UPI001E491266|nr:ABC transporter permease [Mucilaginibacter sp. UR6-1]MCC8409375.1 ABC transporter permease [Mucilaginibacter sp. UR6-1]
MFKNYLKIAWRNLVRNKGFAFTNLLGLTIGITCAMFIFLWVKDEISFDKFNTAYNRIYQAVATRNFKNNIFTDENMVFPLATELQAEYPQVEKAAVTTQTQSSLIDYKNIKLKRDILYVNEAFLDVFTCKFIKGSAAQALKDPSSIVITETFAKAFFGDADPINKVLKLNTSQSVKVSAVIADPPGNSTVRFDALVPFNYSDPDTKRNIAEWRNSSWRVYVKAKPGTTEAEVGRIVSAVMKKHNPDEKVSTYFAYPMSKWHLYHDFKDGKNVGGMIEYVRLFAIIALVILLIACVNFMNLSTARSEKRAKEVGIRKTLGSDRKQLVLQFFAESMILSIIAFTLSVILVIVLIPMFNQLVDKKLVLNFGEPLLWLGALIIILFTGITAGSYPALYLSSFNPVKVLKGSILVGKGAIVPRRVLVVGQFVMSILLISSTIVIYQQLQHVKDRDTGYNANNLIMLPASQGTNKNYDVVKNELLRTGLIKAVNRSFSPVTDIWWQSPGPDYAGKPAGDPIIFSGMFTDAGFSKTLGVRILQGRDFDGVPADSSNMLLNKAAIEAMALKNPVGMKMRYGPKEYTVIGVTDNIVMTSPYESVRPMMTYYSNNNVNWINVRLNDGIQPKKALASIKTIYNKYSPEDLFEYQFADQEYGAKFYTEELIGRVTNIFAGLAIFICCLGLAGLASFTIEKRFREIGIRKVLGATVKQVIMLISTEFLKLVGLAFIIAVPVTWYLMHNWLQKYTYHIDMSIWVFGFVGIGILLLTLVVVSLNTFKAATANPVKSLRSE